MDTLRHELRPLLALGENTFEYALSAVAQLLEEEAPQKEPRLKGMRSLVDRYGDQVREACEITGHATI